MTPAARSLELSQSLDRTDIAYEEEVNLRIAVSWDGPTLAYRFDKPLRIESDRLKVARYSSKVSSTGTGAEEVTTKLFTYTLTPTSAGLAHIEPIVLEYIHLPDSATGQLTTDALTVEIADPVPVETTSGDTSVATWLVLLVSLAGIAGFVVFMILRKKTPKEAPRTPVDAFLEDLTVIKSDAGLDLKRFQTGLYRITVAYLERATGRQLAGQSISAVLAAMDAADLNTAQQEQIGNWLTRAEKEKFSPSTATPGETIRLESEIRAFFEKMR